MSLIAVYTTTATREAAKSLAHALVVRRLVACAQIEAIESVYVWQGEVEESSEWRILFKTTADRYVAVEQAIRALNDYELPAIFAVPVTHAFASYEQWVQDSTHVEA